MTTLLAIVEDTFREGIARKSIIGFFILSNFFLLIALLIAFTVDLNSLVPQQGAANAAMLPIEEIVRHLQALLTGFLYLAALFLSVFATAGVIPNALEKGSIDLILSKPVSRNQLLFGKLIGSALIVFLNIAYYVLGMWLIISIRSGYWNPPFLLVVFPITFSFLVLYAVMMLLGVTTRSSALSIILIYAFLYIISPILSSRELFLYSFISSEAVRGVIDAIFYILPKPGLIGDIAANLVLHKPIDWMPIWTGASFSLVIFALTFRLMQRKDF